MILDAKTMLSFFDSAGRYKYYHWCADISLAGEDHKVKEVVFFVSDIEDPLSDYIWLKKYRNSFLLVGVYTKDNMLISECMEYIDTLRNEFGEIELRTPFSCVLDSDSILKRFSLEQVQDLPNPVYYIDSQSELLNYTGDIELSITQLSDEDRNEIANSVRLGKLDRESWGDGSFKPCTGFKDVKVYIARLKGEIIGYLRAECGYMNVYDIGWLYIEPSYRGMGYAAALVSYFSREMFNADLVPHYGYAISEQSARVAQKCGYKCDETPLICKVLKNLY